MAKKKFYGGNNFQGNLYRFPEVGMPAESFRMAYPAKPYMTGASINDSRSETDYQMKQDMAPLRKGLLRAKY